MSTAALALLIGAMIFGQVIIFASITLWRRRREKIENHHIDRDQSVAPGKSEQSAWQGFTPFRVVQRITENLGGDICSFYLEPEEAIPLPRYKPGQFLTFKFDQLNPAKAGSVIRCYSLSDRYASTHYRISVKRVAAPLDQPTLLPGVVSNYLHDHVQVGDRLMVKAPSGHFHLSKESSLPVVLIAGGIGVTPMLSILNSLVEQGSEREIWFFYAVRNGREVIMRQQLQSLADLSPQVHLHLCFSRPDPEDQAGVDFQHSGRIDMALLQRELGFGRYQFYVCGPAAMMECIVPGLEQLGVQAADIHYEAFGPATPARPQTETTTAEVEESLQVIFSKSGRSSEWTGIADSLLSFIEAEGVDVSSGCRAGSCGSCQTLIEAGEVEYFQEPDVDVETGSCLLCVCRPKSDLKLAL
ncbi:MAG: FAD-binding oxidoreductase [Candidatus Thiodiazotropha sp.]|jgi:uncharacterized protein